MASVLAEAALRYAQAGYRVFPLHQIKADGQCSCGSVACRSDPTKRGKHPRTKNGAVSGTTELELIEKWWTRWPDANIGMCLDGLLLVDEDPRNGGDLDSLGQSWPDTCRQKTGGGGTHLFYRTSNGVHYPGGLAFGIDLKSGANSYAVVEPSRTAAGAYHWLDDSEPWQQSPAPAPAWLAQSGTQQTAASETAHKVRANRNEFLSRRAYQLRKLGYSVTEIEAMLQQINIERCEPPLESAEVSEIARKKGIVPVAETPEPKLLPLALLSQTKPRPPSFVIDDWMPCGHMAGFYGHGGVGKSAIALMQAACIALGVPFFGLPTQRRRVGYYSAEDREGVLHWRLTRICDFLMVSLAELEGWLFLYDAVKADSIMYGAREYGMHVLTQRYEWLQGEVSEHGIEVIYIDALSDAYDADESDRGKVKRFVAAMVALVPDGTGAVVLVGHINKPTAIGVTSREGYSGSTAWHNAARARWYLYPETASPEEPGSERTGALRLELQKSNYGRADQTMRFVWADKLGLFMGAKMLPETLLGKSLQSTEERIGILAAIRGCAKAGIAVPTALSGPMTTHDVLRWRPEFPTSLKGAKGKRQFRACLIELEQQNTIHRETYVRPNRHPGEKWVVTEDEAEK